MGKKYRCCDGNHSEIIEASNIDEACELAESSWQGGDWGEGKAIIEVCVTEIDDCDDEAGEVKYVSVEVGEDPDMPDCNSDDGHDWQSPLECVGGIDSNPGVWSIGGTAMVFRTCCSRCGLYRQETAYGAQRNPGQCDQVEYPPADEDSLAWVASLAEAE